jgi:small redox-active disulfide protein 2
MRKIQVLGPGCDLCRKLAENADAAARSLGIEFTLEKVTDLEQIMRFDVLITPALVVDGVVKSAGKLLSVDEIKALLVL